MQPQPLHDGADVLRPPRDRPGRPAASQRAVPGEVERDDPELLRKRRELRRPETAVREPAVDEDQRRVAGPGDRKSDLDAVAGWDPRLDIFASGRRAAGRHPEGDRSSVYQRQKGSRGMTRHSGLLKSRRKSLSDGTARCPHRVATLLRYVRRKLPHREAQILIENCPRDGLVFLQRFTLPSARPNGGAWASSGSASSTSSRRVQRARSTRG